MTDKQNAYMAQFVGRVKGENHRVRVSCTVYATTEEKAREAILYCYDRTNVIQLTLLKEDVCTS